MRFTVNCQRYIYLYIHVAAITLLQSFPWKKRVISVYYRNVPLVRCFFVQAILGTEIPFLFFCWPAGTIPSSCSLAVAIAIFSHSTNESKTRRRNECPMELVIKKSAQVLHLLMFFLRKVLNTTWWIWCISLMSFRFNLLYPLWNWHSTWKIGLPKRKLVFQSSIFRGYVSLRKGNKLTNWLTD